MPLFYSLHLLFAIPSPTLVFIHLSTICISTALHILYHSSTLLLHCHSCQHPPPPMNLSSITPPTPSLHRLPPSAPPKFSTSPDYYTEQFMCACSTYIHAAPLHPSLHLSAHPSTLYSSTHPHCPSTHIPISTPRPFFLNIQPPLRR